MKIEYVKQVTVIGGGLMGCGIAQVMAAGEGIKVAVYDTFVSGDGIMERIHGNLQLLINEEVMTEKEREDLMAKISTYTDLEEAVKDADFVIECIPEKMDLKQELFKNLEPICPDRTVFLTNTSVMSITEISMQMADKSRLVGTHFWNPPYLIPLVEVVKSDYTAEVNMDITMALLEKVGKHPIRVQKDVPGFVANRLQHALWREAISIVENGIADAKTVDEAVRMSFGLRLPVLAPMENADMVGLDLTFQIHDYILKHIESSKEPSPLLKEKMEAGDLGFKSGKGFMEWDDASMAASREALTKHLIHMIYKK